MATIKSYTDLEQSKKLAEFLSFKSADMHYERAYFEGKQSDWFVKLGSPIKSDDILPCWSLAALLSVLPKVINNETLFIETSLALWHIGYRNIYTARADNLVDACYELILKLNELKML